MGEFLPLLQLRYSNRVGKLASVASQLLGATMRFSKIRILLGAICIIFALPAGAADTGMQPQEHPTRTLVYSGFDFNSQSAYTGFLGGNFAPWGDLETSGFRFSLFGAAGSYRYDLGPESPTAIRGTFETGDVLVGYGFNKDSLSAKFMIGLNVQNHSLSSPDPANPVQGTHAGLKLQGDFYANPTPETMVFGLGSYSTAFQTYYTEFKGGLQLFGIKELYFGPQFIAQGNAQYDQWRVGAHVTGITYGRAEFGFAGGYLQDSRNGPGAYGMVTFDLNF
jgi:hypothetical protein